MASLFISSLFSSALSNQPFKKGRKKKLRVALSPSLRRRDPCALYPRDAGTLSDGRGGARAKTASGLGDAKKAQLESSNADGDGDDDCCRAQFRALRRGGIHPASRGASAGNSSFLFARSEAPYLQLHAERDAKSAVEPGSRRASSFDLDVAVKKKKKGRFFGAPSTLSYPCHLTLSLTFFFLFIITTSCRPPSGPRPSRRWPAAPPGKR